jgi:signal transduction histidine kinase
LTNVHRHSGASEVCIRFQHQAETVILEIRDCGCGIPTELVNRLREASLEAGVGLAGMRERLNELNGNLEIESNGHGTSLRAVVPLPAMVRSAQRRDCGQVGFQQEGCEALT